MLWYAIGAALWLVSLILVIAVFRIENARNSHRAMQLEKRFTDLKNSVRLRRGLRSTREELPLPREGTIDN